MARSSYLLYHLFRRRFSESFGGLFFIPITLALVTSFLILFYISSTSHLFTRPRRQDFICTEVAVGNSSQLFPPISAQKQKVSLNLFEFGASRTSKRSKGEFRLGSKGKYMYNEVFHDRDIFMEDYLEMNKSFKIYVYPHSRNDPFANALLPVDFEPGGNYASESFFKKNLLNSHFITNDPAKADLFFLPFSIARLRHDSRVGVAGLQDFVGDYIHNISHNYPFWNRTGGVDHFYAACHSVGKSAMEKADAVRFNAIQVVCSSSYFLSGYVATRMHVCHRFGQGGVILLILLLPEGRNSLSLLDLSIHQHVKSLFKNGQMTQRSQFTLVGSQHPMPMSYFLSSCERL